MRKMNIVLWLVLAAFVFTGCSKNGGTALDNSGSQNTGSKAQSSGIDSPTDIAMEDFFLADGSKAHYQGEGNEFAELDIEVAHPYKNYVIIHENNGGGLVRYTYKIDRDEILILENKLVETRADFPSLEELDAMASTGVYLKKPFKKGTSFGDWTIVETDVTLETPYKTFDRVFVIESQDTDIVNRKYFVEGFGEVKRESIMKTEEGEHIVTSTLKAVDQ
ncbi:hypothetical protein [Sporosarcina sp. NPDC096371]|uniref:hypothetical protein n=1 Tax=Sporosarcina sp. NPDC096371 TaxID=3364530 RepID=UPI003802EDFC